MTPLRLVALLALAGATGYVWWIYLRRELPVRGRPLLAALRTAVLALVVILLVDLELPGSPTAADRTIVDRSASMEAPLVDGSVPVQSAAGTPTADPGAQRDTFDGVPATGDSTSRFSERVARAIEVGAGRVTLVTDGRIADPVELRSLLSRAPVDFEVIDVGGEVVNAGVEFGAVPPDVRAGQEFEVPVTVFREGGTAAISLDLLVEGEVVATESIPAAPQAGEGSGPTRLELRPRIAAPDASGPLRLTARVVLEGDRFERDDRRSAVIEVDRERGAIAVVSIAPGWEARYLTSTLAEVAGLPVVAFLRMPTPEGERFLRSGEGPAVVGVEEVRRAVEDAALVVLDGTGPLDSLVARAIEAAPRRIVLGEAGDGPAGFGEWYVSGELPSSPLAAELSGVRLLGLPPLRRTGTVELSGTVGTPLAIALDGTGDPMPAMLLRMTERGREARVPTRGWWRWALRPGDPATLYRRLWSGVAGWVLAGGDESEASGIAPVVAVVDPAAEVAWRAPAAADARMEVRWAAWGDDEEAVPARLDTVQVPASGNLVTPPLDEGDWRWIATILDGDNADRERSGRLVSESWSGDLLVPRDPTISELRGAPRAAAVGGRPLRTSPVPWILILGLLAAEWIVRRRTGLR